jgi:tetratricopeptide (TPR) repeat protein
MFSSRNVHFAILGIILGSVAGYILAFYKAYSMVPPDPAAAASPADTSSAEAPPDQQPEFTDEQMVGLFKGAIERNPDNIELLSRFGNYLFDIERYGEAVEWYQKALAKQPSNIDIRTDLATALYSMGRVDEAMGEYQKSLTTDPRHMLTLHNMVVLYIDSKKDFDAAESTLKQMEQINPSYEALPALRQKLADDRATFRR